VTRKRSSVNALHSQKRSSQAFKKYTGKRRTRRIWIRVLVCSVVVLVLAVGGTALGSYLWLDAKVSAANGRVPDDVWDALKGDSSASGNGASPGSENILLVGSDTRSDELVGSQSDVIMLVHVDQANNYLSMLSLPRDLRVQVEGNGWRKLNWAYAAGGPALLIKTIQQVTGADIDHYVQMDFHAFTDMTDSLGGVYLEVDRRYPSLSPDEPRGSLEPGYQLLDGVHALNYVRYRFDTNYDFGRMARQQRFLRALRQQAMGWDLGLKLPGLVGGLLDNVATDLGTNDLVGLSRWGIEIDGERMRQVVLRGEGRMIDGVAFAVCTDQQIDDAVSALLTPPSANAASGATIKPIGKATTANPAAASILANPAAASRPASRVALSTGATTMPGVSSTSGGQSTIQNPTAWTTVARRVAFPVEGPTYVAKGFSMAPRNGTYAYQYGIHVGNGEMPSLVMLYKNTGTGRSGNISLQEEYINITETTWVDAPAASKGREVTYNGTIYTVVSDAGEVDRIWWRADGVLYWVSNSLSRVASQGELLSMAKSMVRVTGQ
jgi:LCP family protein required for cell wall assembly